MMDWYGGGVGWAAWLLMAAMMVAFWGVVVTVVVLVAHNLGRDRDRDRDTRARQRDPQEILDERLARGEIDEQEYRRRRELLRRSTPDGP